MLLPYTQEVYINPVNRQKEKEINLSEIEKLRRSEVSSGLEREVFSGRR